MKELGSTKAIPASRRQILNDPNELPDRYSSTPGGTLYSTTPGGTRIIYERNFLMNLKNSPLARSPPNMSFIPGVTNIEPTSENPRYEVLEKKNNIHNKKNSKNKNHNHRNNNNNHVKHHRDEQPQFDIDI